MHVSRIDLELARTARRPGIDMPAMPVGPLGDAMIQ
jgi:hypothetical protein